MKNGSNTRKRACRCDEHVTLLLAQRRRYCNACACGRSQEVQKRGGAKTNEWAEKKREDAGDRDRWNGQPPPPPHGTFEKYNIVI